MATEPILVSCFDSFERARAAAGGCLDDGAQPSPFDRLDWFEGLHHRSVGRGNPCILQARAGRAQAWLFLAETPEGGLGGIANWYSFQFRPQFVDAPDRETRIALLAAIAVELRRMGHQLHFYPVIDDDLIDAALIQQAFRGGGWSVIARTMARKRLLQLPPDMDFARYWAERPGALRSTHKRKTQRHPLDISIHRQIDDALWAALETVFAASWKPHGDDFLFLRAFAEAEAAAGRLRLGLARQDGLPVAVELWTVEQGRAYIHKLAFDERAADASPGTQLSHAMFRQAIDSDKARLIDFGTGDNDYKAAWVPDSVPMQQIDAFDMRNPHSWRPAIAIWMSALHQPDRAPARAHGKKSGGRKAALAGRAGR